MMRHFQDHLIPIDNYEKHAERLGNTESRFAIAIKELGLKVKKVPKNPPSTNVNAIGGTWYDILGFRHIHGEWNYAHRYKDIPPPAKYIDETFWQKKRELVKKYYETKDNKFLQQWYKIR
jgi:hypothetical protein